MSCFLHRVGIYLLFMVGLMALEAACSVRLNSQTCSDVSSETIYSALHIASLRKQGRCRRRQVYWKADKIQLLSLFAYGLQNLSGPWHNLQHFLGLRYISTRAHCSASRFLCSAFFAVRGLAVYVNVSSLLLVRSAM